MSISSNSALGLIEVYGFIGAIEGADASLKAASVSLVGVEAVKGGITTVMITGNVAAVKAGIEAAEAALMKIGIKSKTHVIPRIAEDTARMINAHDECLKNKKSRGFISKVSWSLEKATVVDNQNINSNRSVSFEKMTMQELRSYARKIGIPDTKVRIAKKEELLKLVKLFITEGKEE